MSDTGTKSKFSEAVSQFGIYAASIGIGVVSMWSSIRHNFNDNMKSTTDWFDKIRDDRSAAIKSLDSINGAEHVAEHLKIHKNYSNAMRSIVEEKGYTNSFKKFKFLAMHQKVQVVGIAIAVATVAVGVIMNVRDSKQNDQIKKKITEIDRKLEAKNSVGVH